MPVIQIRAAHQTDLPAMAKVRVDTWRAAYRGIVPDDFLAHMSYQTTAERWQKAFWEDREPGVEAFVAESESGEIVGIAVCGPQRGDVPDYQGGIYILYVLPGYQKDGIGRRLVAACVQHLVQRMGAETMLIWVLAENPSRRFYERLGGRVVCEKTMEIGGKLLVEVGYGWDAIPHLLEE